MDALQPNTELVKRLLEGHPDAEAQVFQYYARRLAHLAEQHLSQKVKSREDGEDVVQSVFRTFFRRSSQGDFQIDNSNQLWALLVKMTLRKARTKARHHSAERRDVRAETVDEDGEVLMTMAQGPNPEEGACLADLIEETLRGLPPLFGEVLQLRLEGWSVVDIAGKMQVARQTIYRILKVLQERLK